MNVNSLFAICPIDGRYFSQTSELVDYFSEFAFMKYRIHVELSYLTYLSKWKIVRALKTKEKNILNEIEKNFSEKDATRIKQFENETKHDVKAVEYFLKEKFTGTTIEDLLPFVHFGLTSEDINNLSYSLMLSDANKNIVIPALKKVLESVKNLSAINVGSVMLARTHGQPAVPTTFGKELAVFFKRISRYQDALARFSFEGKLNGAVGNYNALVFLFPKIDWIKFSRSFILALGLVPNIVTTQILPADTIVDYMTLLAHVNTICIGLCQDMWQYIGRGLVTQKIAAGQVGSSTMPQKINPIDFENAEGNLHIANSYFDLYGGKLLLSRLQRDLSDSTVKRTIGTALGHTLIAWKNVEKGFKKISFNTDFALHELDEHWEVLAEAIQMFMKLHGDSAGYEKVKKMLMGKRLDGKTYKTLVREFPPLAKLKPVDYIGLVKKITTLALT